MIKVPEVYKQSHSLYCQSSYGEGERGGDGEGEEREGREEGRERGGEEGRGGGRGGDGESTHSPYCHNISLSLQLCEEELKTEHVIHPSCILFLSYTRAGWEYNDAVLFL